MLWQECDFLFVCYVGLGVFQISYPYRTRTDRYTLHMLLPSVGLSIIFGSLPDNITLSLLAIIRLISSVPSVPCNRIPTSLSTTAAATTVTTASSHGHHIIIIIIHLTSYLQPPSHTFCVRNAEGLYETAREHTHIQNP